MITYSSVTQILLVFLATKLLADTVHCQEHAKSQRHRRDWIPPATKLMENVDYTKEDYVALIGSDLADKVRFTLKGPGADLPPYNLFVVEEDTGKIRLTGILDREEIPLYKFFGTAWYTKSNTIAEDSISLHFEVGDQNDNPPVFIKPEPASVYEGSPVDTLITQVHATDADLPNSNHTKIAFSLIKQDPDGKQFFFIDRNTGCIYVRDSALDREKQTSYVLTVKATDMDGAPGGNTATTTVKIYIKDINDNVPTLEQDEYEVSVDENVADVEVLRVQALDIDEKRTDNWLAVFDIVSGNEDGYFNIKTDPATNEGVLYLNKPIDFEAVSDLNLGVVVKNKAHEGAPSASADAGGAGGGTGFSGAGGWSGPGHSGTGLYQIKQKIYAIKVKVINRPDGPKYPKNPKIVPLSENTKGSSVPRVIATYPATDEDTGKPAEHVRYAKGYDPANWLSIDENTAEIKLKMMPDRESPYVNNGTYYAKILCMTDDVPSLTATGTLELQIEDSNDNCPTLLTTMQQVCTGVSEVNVTAEDMDASPNGAPFQFIIIPQKTQGKWNVKKKSAVEAALLPEEPLWPGSYKVSMEIKDQQGLACPETQVLEIEVCTCSEEGFCKQDPRSGIKPSFQKASSASLGASGIGILLLGVLILLVALVFLLYCELSCGGVMYPKLFNDMPADVKEKMISYNTEGPGEDKDVPLMSAALLSNCRAGHTVSNKFVDVNSNVSAHEGKYGHSYYLKNSMKYIYNASRHDSHYKRVDGMALPDTFLKQHFTLKATKGAENVPLNDGLLVCTYEGQGSSAGSVSSESLLESFDELDFLDDLGPKFTTLAEVCGFKCHELEPVISKAVPEHNASIDTTKVFTHERTADIASSGHVMQTTSTIAETQSGPILMNEDASTNNHMLVVQAPSYYMVKQVPSTVLLASQASAELTQGTYIVNGMAGGERPLLKQSYHVERNPSVDQQAVLSGDSAKYIVMSPNSATANSFLYQGYLQCAHQGSFPGETNSEAMKPTSGHSVVGQTSGLNNETTINDQHVVVMEKTSGQAYMVLGDTLHRVYQ
ncbi:desmoglein-2.1-like [Hoplias malabaricus]|uniref:desmoglein-2.1-like n=1 Tax=Hoplias malabaricus TaxID=27720 RepID=UPI0034635916